MGLVDKIFKTKVRTVQLGNNVSDDDIVALADGELIDVHTVSDPVFAEEMMGKSIAFRYTADTVVLCSPANGTLSVLFPTGHAYGITTNEGVELLVHCGINTVNAKGDGFKVLSKKQGDRVDAGDPIVEVDFKKLAKSYDMSTMLIVTNANGRDIDFLAPQHVSGNQSVIK